MGMQEASAPRERPFGEQQKQVRGTWGGPAQTTTRRLSFVGKLGHRTILRVADWIALNAALMYLGAPHIDSWDLPGKPLLSFGFAFAVVQCLVALVVFVFDVYGLYSMNAFVSMGVLSWGLLNALVAPGILALFIAVWGFHANIRVMDPLTIALYPPTAALFVYLNMSVSLARRMRVVTDVCTQWMAIAGLTGDLWNL